MFIFCHAMLLLLTAMLIIVTYAFAAYAILMLLTLDTLLFAPAAATCRLRQRHADS